MAIRSQFESNVRHHMGNISSLFEQYGVLAVFSGVLIEQLGAPVPALPFLLLAGAAAANDGMFALHAFLAAAGASMLADSVWFFAGKRYGRRVLNLLCKVSISPDSCVRQSELNFAKLGVAALVIAKFVPGLSTLAPPLAGSLGMRNSAFLLFNLAGTALWAGSGIAAGLLFNSQIERMMSALSDLGGVALSVVAVLVAAYIAFRVWRRWKVAKQLAALPRIAPAELAALLKSGHAPIVIDVRATSIQSIHGKRIPGARPVELAALDMLDMAHWPGDALIITYCACPNDVSALKAAHILSRKGLTVQALAGGIDAWAAAGHELEIIA